MTIFDIFSKRQAQARGEVVDVYQYEDVPQELRTQLVRIFRRTIGDSPRYNREGARLRIFRDVQSILCDEYGKFELTTQQERAYSEGEEADVTAFVLFEPKGERVLDAVELMLKMLSIAAANPDGHYEIRQGVKFEDVIREVNKRFIERGCGYQFEGGILVRVDSQFAHKELILPSLHLLRDAKFKTANSEYLAAHSHYRKREFRDCLADCLNAFESVMKVICNEMNWQIDEKATASRLVAACIDNGLLPSFQQQQLTATRTFLQSAVPTSRNRLAGHGQGVHPQPVPQHAAAFGLHATAANILLLAASLNDLKPSSS